MARNCQSVFLFKTIFLKRKGKAYFASFTLSLSFSCLRGILVELFLHRSQLMYRSSRPEVFCKLGALRNFTKFTGKHLCQGLFLNKVAGLRPTTLLKKGLWHKCFTVNFAKFLRAPFFTEHLRWLLLNLSSTELYQSVRAWKGCSTKK